MSENRTFGYRAFGLVRSVCMIVQFMYKAPKSHRAVAILSITERSITEPNGLVIERRSKSEQLKNRTTFKSAEI